MHSLKSPDNSLVRIAIEAVCHDCKHRHRIDVLPDDFGRSAFDWERKHKDHCIEFLSPSRFIPKGFDDRIFMEEGEAPWWLDYRHNADTKIAYAADAQYTITLASLGTSATWVAGQEATSVSNGSNKYLDYEITGKITTGTSPTANTEIRIYGIKPINDTPTWPDVFDGTDSAETLTNTNIRDSLPLLWNGTVASTSNITYPIISALTLAQLWGIVPDNHTVFVTHATAVALNSTGSNHELSYRGIYTTTT